MTLSEQSRQFLADHATEVPLESMPLADARALNARTAALSGPGPEVAAVRQVTLESADGGRFDVRVLSPESPRSVIVYYHGGGWVLGDIDTYDTLGRHLAVRAGATVVMVDYRRAPEHRFPVAVDDSWAALRWAADTLTGGTTAAGGPLPLVVAGDSAGGNLAAVIAQRSRDRSGPPIALQVLVYPITDCDFNRDSYRDPDNQLMLTDGNMRWFWDCYADPEQRTRPDASPLRAESLAGLPEAVVLLAEHDVLHDEGEDYVAALRAAGVPVTVERAAGQMHAFFTMVGVLDASSDALDTITTRINERLVAQQDH